MGSGMFPMGGGMGGGGMPSPPPMNLGPNPPNFPMSSGSSSPSLPSMVSNLESSGGATAGQQPKGMSDPTYGQFPAFAKQWGTGPGGINNFAQAVLKNKPEATVGDFYANYVMGTGNPGKFSFGDLKTHYPDAYHNFITRSGVSPDILLKSLQGFSY